MNKLKKTSIDLCIYIFDISILIVTVPKFSECFRWIWARIDCLSVGFLCLSQIFTHVISIMRHRTKCSECYWQHSNEGQSQADFCIEYEAWFFSHNKTHPVEILWKRFRTDAQNSTYTTQKLNHRQTYMSSVRFEPVIPEANGHRPKP